MARGSEIILAANPKGHFEECLVSGTPKPGTCMQMTSAAPVGGRYTYAAVSRNDGAKGPVTVLLADWGQGRTADDAYVTGKRGFIYWPIAGEELNMRMRDQPGTGTLGIENIGDLLEIDGASGMLQAVGTGGPTGTHASAPFMLMEHGGVDNTTDVLIFVKYLGNNA